MRGERSSSNNDGNEHANQYEQPGIPGSSQREKECEKYRRREYCKIESPKEQPKEHHDQREHNEATGQAGKSKPFVGDCSLSNTSINRYGTYNGCATDEHGEN